MVRVLTLLLGTLLAATLLRADQTAPAATEPFTARERAQGYRDHVILAKPHAHRRATVDADESREGVRVRRRLARLDDLRIIDLDAIDHADAAIARLRATGRYEFVERDVLRHADTTTPNDPRFGEQWALANTGSNPGASNGIPGADIRATLAWDTRTDASSVIVAVIDSGVRLTHPDLQANLWVNPREIAGNGRDDDANGYLDDVNGINAIVTQGTASSGNPTDDNGHGTHVAGIIGAVGNNGTGISGVAWRVKIMALKGLAAGGTGATSDLVECINYAIANGAQIINASYGAAATTTGQGFSASELTAIRAARDAGIIFVAAAGNDATDLELSLHYPASHRVDNVIAVGNLTNRDDLSGSSSNFGSGSVELFAPGTSILSLGYTADTGTSAYVVKSGTSMSAPQVVGALALLKAQFPTDTYRQLINRLLRTVDPLATLHGKCQTGGRLNLARAITSAPDDNRPFNDTFANRARLVGGNFLVRSSNVGATAEPGEPAILNFAPAASLWWEWTPATTAPVRLSTTGSGYDTLVAVYRGTSLGDLSLVAGNDDDGGVTTSRLEFTAQAGVTYQIKVDGKNGGTGATFMDIGVVPANDAFAAAQVITGRSVRIDAANANCTRESGEPRILNSAGGKSLWYRWTAPAAARFQIAVTSDGFDPLLAVYTGTTLANLTLVGANDNLATTGTDTGSLVTLEAVAGTTYYFQIDGKPAATNQPPPNGAFVLTVNDSRWQAITGNNITCAPAVAPDGSVYVGSIDQSLHAFDADGTLRWSAATGGLLDTSAAAIAPDGTIYAGSNDGRLYAFAPTSATPRWAVTVASGSSAGYAPAVAPDGTIYLRCADGYLYALNPADGVQRWRARTPGSTTQSYGSPTIAPDGTIYVGADDKKLYAVRPDGTIKWTFPAENEIYTAPALDAAGNLYFGVLTSGKLYSVAPDGTPRWVYAGATLGTSSSPVLSPDGGTVYFAAYDAKLHAVDAATGAARWTFPLGREVRASSPAVDANGVVYVGCYDGLLYAVNPDGTLKRTWATADWIRSSPAISGTTLYVGSNDHKLYAFDLGVGPAPGPWAQFRGGPRRLGRVVNEALAIALQPESQTAIAGRSVSVGVTATGNPPLTYQWQRNGREIVGAIGSMLTLDPVTAADAGTYTVVVTGPQGSVRSAPATLTVLPGGPSRLLNVSARANVGAGRILIVGLVMSGGAKPVLLRAVGPGLGPLVPAGIPLIDDARLLVYGPTGTLVQANDNWGGDPVLAAAFTAVGAFPLSTGSLDAALVRSVDGVQTAHLVASGSGLGLIEAYDATAAFSPRLVNLSARYLVGNGARALIAGFVIDGPGAMTLLIRGIGPALAAAPFRLTGVLADPQLDVFDGAQQRVAGNNDWPAGLADTFAATGAFTLTPGSRDAALVVTLPPGAYTAQLTGVNGATGEGLVEIYEVP
jgi:outer membrane protein assembly factor BamB